MTETHYISFSNIREGMKEEFSNDAFIDAIMERLTSKEVRDNLTFDVITENIIKQSSEKIDTIRIKRVISNIKEIAIEHESFLFK